MRKLIAVVLGLLALFLPAIIFCDDINVYVYNQPRSSGPVGPFYALLYGQLGTVNIKNSTTPSTPELYKELGLQFFSKADKDVLVCEELYGLAIDGSVLDGGTENNIISAGIKLGGRYFPRNPTFDMGDIKGRLTASVLAGVGAWNSGPGFDLVLTGTLGILFSSAENSEGLLLDAFVHFFNYSSSSITVGDPAIGISIGWVFGIGT